MLSLQSPSPAIEPLDQDGQDVLGAVVAGELAWSSPWAIACALARPLEWVLDQLAALESLGWLASWETAHATFVTLSPIAAAQLEVRLVEIGLEEAPRWATTETPDPSPPKAVGIFRDYTALADVGSYDPIDLDAEAPQLVLLAGDAAGGSSPTFLPVRIQGASVPWPGPYLGGPCEVCMGRRGYCIYCDGPDIPTKQGRAAKARQVAAAREARRRVDAA